MSTRPASRRDILLDVDSDPERPGGTLPFIEGQQSNTSPGPLASDSPLGALLTRIYSELSNRMAGGRRVDLNLLNPVTGEPIDAETEGFLPEDIEPQLPSAEQWFDPVMFRSPEQSDLQLSSIPKASSGAGREGEGLDWFRTGQAPNNYANRNHPLYKARMQFIADHVAPTIAELFPGMTVTGQNYYRPPGGGGGQAKNSDHQSAGALDVFGTPEQMAALRNWVVEQPWSSFVRFNSPHHYDHVHISVDIGWIAENFYGGKAPPPMRGVAETDRAGTQTTQAPDLPDSPGSGGVRVL